MSRMSDRYSDRYTTPRLAIRAHPIRAHRWLPALLMGLALTGLSAGPSRAQCVEFTDRAPQIDLDTFVKSPTSLLERLRNDKEKLKYQLATYIATDPSILSSVKTLAAEATSSDRSAIGAALRLAESRCTSKKPNAARKIRDFVQRLGDQTVLAGYTVAGEDQESPTPGLPDRDKKQPNRSGDLLQGEWKTQLADPFKPLPIPR